MLNPLLLWFLPLALLPVILHLLNLNRLREVELPTFRFLMEGYVQERSRIKLIEWLLLLLRTAVVLLVVGALARPVVQRFSTLFGSGVKDVVFVLDAGMSTGLVSEGSSALHRGREAVRGAVGRLGAADFVTLVRAGMEPRVLHRAVLGDGRRLQAELDSVEPDPGPADLAAAVTEALAAPARGPRSLWIVSDGQRRSWDRLRENPVARQVPDDVQLVLVDIGAVRSPANVALLGDPPRPQRPVVGLPVELTARVEAAGNGSSVDGAAIEVPLSVTVDEELVTQTTVTIPPGQVVSVPLSVVPARAGVIKARLDLPADAFPFDDSMFFVLNVERRVGVIVVTSPGVEGLADPALFLAAALESPRESLTAALGDDAPQVEGEERIARSLDVQVVRADLLDERRIQEADVIVIADARLDGHRTQWVRRRIEEGAGLVVFAGPKQGAAEEIAGLGGFGGRDAAPLRWLEPVGNPDDETGGRGFGQIDLTHPLFAPFRTASERPAEASAGGRLEAFDTLRVFRHVPLGIVGRNEAGNDKVPAPVRSAPVTVLARLDDDSPVIAETRIGRGRVVARGLAVTPDWSNLPVHPAFVPLLLRAVQTVRPDPPAVAAESVHPYEPAPIRLDERWKRSVVQATDPAGTKTAIETVAGDGRVTGALEETRRIGYYEFDVQPPVGITADPIRLGMAVNREVDGATIERIDAAELGATFDPHPATVLAGTADDPTLHTQFTSRREIWRWLISAVFLLFGVEFLLSTLKAPEPRRSGDAPRGWGERINDWLAGAVGMQAADGAEPGSP
jgi:hypothetical protein